MKMHIYVSSAEKKYHLAEVNAFFISLYLKSKLGKYLRMFVQDFCTFKRKTLKLFGVSKRLYKFDLSTQCFDTLILQFVIAYANSTCLYPML